MAAAAICQLKANRNKWEAQIKEAKSLNTTRVRVSSLPTLDAALYSFFLKAREIKMQISPSLLQQRAKDLAAELLAKMSKDDDEYAGRDRVVQSKQWIHREILR